MNENGKYYAVFEEWLYPTESGRDFIADFDTMKDAQEYAREMCDKERFNFASATGCDPLPTNSLLDKDGDETRYLITAKDGYEDWWYSTRIVVIQYGEGISEIG